MGHRANFVIVEAGTAAAYYDQWAALGCVETFADGPDAARGSVEQFEPVTVLMDWGFAEGGYLLDFDERVAIVFGAAQDVDDLFGEGADDIPGVERMREIYDACSESPSTYLRYVAGNWSGWRLRWDEAGVDAISAYLRERGFHDITAADDSHPDDCERYDVEA